MGEGVTGLGLIPKFYHFFGGFPKTTGSTTDADSSSDRTIGIMQRHKINTEPVIHTSHILKLVFLTFVPASTFKAVHNLQF